jgi:HSP20 family protein
MWPTMLVQRAWNADPFQTLERAQRMLDPWFTEGWLRQADAPAMNLWTNADGGVLSVELPGIDPKDVAITVEGDAVSIEGERKPEAVGEQEVFHRSERRQGPFSRLARLPFEIEAERVTASYEHGVLRVTLPRKESSKPRRIAINA